MPNVKIFVDEAFYPSCRAALAEALPPLRDLLCRELGVPPTACQLAVLPVMGLPDQPRLNMELHILPRADRTRERLLTVCTLLQQVVSAAAGTPAAVRLALLDPATYIALK